MWRCAAAGARFASFTTADGAKAAVRALAGVARHSVEPVSRIVSGRCRHFPCGRLVDSLFWSSPPRGHSRDGVSFLHSHRARDLWSDGTDADDPQAPVSSSHAVQSGGAADLCSNPTFFL